MFDTLGFETEGRLALVTLARPERRNAFSARLLRQLIALARELEDRADLDVVIVTGAGGVFSAGADLKDPSRWQQAGSPLAAQRESAGLGYRMTRAWEALPQVTIAAIERYAIGGGFAFAVALDWRVAAHDAFLSLPEISLGIPLSWGTLPRLAQLGGPARAKRLAILCERMPAAQAHAEGYVDWLSEPGGALALAREVAARVLAQPREPVRMTKEAVNAHATLGAHAAAFMGGDQFQLAAQGEAAVRARAAARRRR